MAGPFIKHMVRVLVVFVMLLPALAFAAPIARAQSNVVINEIVAANDSYVDNFGATPDWIELQNNGSTVNLGGWTISDDGNSWVFPSVTLGAGQRLVLFASNFDETSPRLHTNFSLKRSGETVSLANASGSLVDSITFPELDDDQSYGRGSTGGVGFLLAATPELANTALAPSSVSITTPPQSFQGSLQVTATATLAAGEQVRYTTNGQQVGFASPIYNGPITINNSTVVRMAVVGNGVVGPESSAGYIGVSSTIADFTSDLPIIMVHSTDTVGLAVEDAIVTVIDRGPDGRASVFGEADYTGFAGLRVRGATSSEFPKKQYKFELWGDRFDNEVDANLLGLGTDSDWALYAPGFYDRAMINNPFMYQLAKDVGIVSPDYQFVELYIEDNFTSTIGSSDYRGLYVLRETIKVGNNRVDIRKHTPTSTGDQGGFIFRYDWFDTCCADLENHPDFGSRIVAHTPDADDITPAQLAWAKSYWNSVQSASQSSFADADALIDFDSFIDHWLLAMLALDVDILRASHYFVKDAGGQLEAGPLWDFDRALGGADDRINELSEARRWNVTAGGHSYESDIYDDLWDMPEVQARLRARWAELRAAEFSEASLDALVDSLGSEIAEAYVREDAKWGSTSGYGARFGNLNGELDHMKNWLEARTEWIDGQFLTTNDPPNVTEPSNPLTFVENVAFSYQVQARDSQTMVFAADGLPRGLSINESTGLISGTVAYGDGWRTFSVPVTVSDSAGAIDHDQHFDVAELARSASGSGDVERVQRGCPRQVLDAEWRRFVLRASVWKRRRLVRDRDPRRQPRYAWLAVRHLVREQLRSSGASRPIAARPRCVA